MKDRAPAFQFYPRQFSGDEQVLMMDLDAVGAHILLICAAGASPERYRIPAEERAVRTLLRNPSAADWERIQSQLLAGAWKVSEDGKWWKSDGLRKVIEKQQSFSEAQRDRANARYRKSAEWMPDSCRTSTETLPSSSSSSSKKEIRSEPHGSNSTLAPEGKAKQEPSSPGRALAAQLKARILQNNPSAKVRPGRPDEWAREADRMMNLDGRTHEQISALIEWSQRHPFWLKNILSMGKLREQFDRLTLDMKSPNASGAEAEVPPRGHTSLPLSEKLAQGGTHAN